MVEAKRRDHRVLGKKLDLFSLQEDAGGGLVSTLLFRLASTLWWFGTAWPCDKLSCFGVNSNYPLWGVAEARPFIGDGYLEKV